MKLFGTSGIRGLYGDTVTEGLALNVGKAMGALSGGTIAVGMDSRTSGPSLKSALVAGILSQGADVIDVGVAPTPTVGVAIRDFGCDAGVVITASHNPPQYNGIKIWDSRGVAYQALEEQVERMVYEESFSAPSWNRVGILQTASCIERHIEGILDLVQVSSSFTVAVDCGCGAGSAITPYVLERMGMRVISLNCQQSGYFPRGLEPSAENLKGLCGAVGAYGCDIGVANDGDADRIGAVDEKGEYLSYDVLLSLIAGYACERSPSSHPTIVTTVDASMCLDEYVSGFGGTVIRTKVGDVAMAQDVVAHGAVFGGEPSGTWIFPDHWLTPDGVLAAVKLIEMKDAGITLSEQRTKVPSFVTLRDKIPICAVDRRAFEARIVEELASEPYESLLAIDGIRVEYESSWALYRFSGTEPLFRITVEAATQAEAKARLAKARQHVGVALRKQ